MFHFLSSPLTCCFALLPHASKKACVDQTEKRALSCYEVELHMPRWPDNRSGCLFGGLEFESKTVKYF